MTALALVALLATAAAPLLAQSNAERVLGGHYTPSHDFDLVHQRIEVGNFDWDSTSFDGRVTTTLVSLRPGLDSVVLDMGRRLEVRRVTGECARAGARCAPLAFSHPGDKIAVRLVHPAAFRDTVRFTIEYHGRITHSHGLYFFKADAGPPRRLAQIYSGGGTDGNPNWIPTYAPPHDKTTWELIATVPQGFTVVSNGRLVSDRPAAAGHTVHWSQERPASTYLISIVVAPLARLQDRWRDVPLDYYVAPHDTALARPLFAITPDVMELFTRLTGVKYPWPKYAQTAVTDFIGGMENVSATTLVDWFAEQRTYMGRPWYRDVLIPHELAHQWFGNYVTAENWAHYWLNEGFAEFMTAQYWAAKFGPPAEDEYFLGKYEQYLTIDARRRMPLAAHYSNVAYPKGALVLRMLKRRLGPERFWAAIHRYLTKHALGPADSDDLRRAVLDATGENLDWFWDQWVYQAGYPELTVSTAYDSSAAALTLTVRQTQVDTGRADSTGLRFSTPLVFRMPVAIRVGTARGDVTACVWLDRREQTVRIEGVRSEPTMVIFDDGNANLKRLTFEQPTRWLVNQLARDPDPWNRRWVLEQLSRRSDDPLAAAALSGHRAVQSSRRAVGAEAIPQGGAGDCFGRAAPSP